MKYGSFTDEAEFFFDFMKGISTEVGHAERNRGDFGRTREKVQTFDLRFRVGTICSRIISNSISRFVGTCAN